MKNITSKPSKSNKIPGKDKESNYQAYLPLFSDPMIITFSSLKIALEKVKKTR
jgi:hypothetical protein